MFIAVRIVVVVVIVACVRYNCPSSSVSLSPCVFCSFCIGCRYCCCCICSTAAAATGNGGGGSVTVAATPSKGWGLFAALLSTDCLSDCCRWRVSL